MRALDPADPDRLAEALSRGYGVPPDALEGWHLRTPEDGDVVFASRADPEAVPGEAVRAGVRLGSWSPAGFRLSIEGADLLEAHVDPVVDLDEDRGRRWLAGEDVSAPEGVDGPFVVLRWQGQVVGAGPVVDGVVENHLPRDRRIAHPPWED